MNFLKILQDMGTVRLSSVNDDKNNALYEKYRELAALESGVVFGGRLGEYRYYDMDQVIDSALRLVDRELSSKRKI